MEWKDKGKEIKDLSWTVGIEQLKERSFVLELCYESDVFLEMIKVPQDD